MARKRLNHKQPRANTTARRFVWMDGTARACVTDLVIYSRGNCAQATFENPHNRGEQPQTCDSCFAVT